MGYDDGFYNQNQRLRENHNDPVGRIASEIFNHDLFAAARETQMLMRGRGDREAQMIVTRINSAVDQMTNAYGPQDDYSPSNHLRLDRGYDQRSGRQFDNISMVSSDGYHHKVIAQIPFAPYDRVPPNFNRYQNGEPQAPGYYNGANVQYDQWGRPIQQGNYGDNSQQQAWVQPPLTPPYSYQRNSYYPPGYGGYGGYGGYNGGALTTGLIINTLARGLFRR